MSDSEQYSSLVEKVIQLHSAMSDIDRRLEAKDKSDEQWRGHIFKRHEIFDAKLDALHSRIDDFGGISAAANATRRDLDAHVADHRWWFGALASAATMIAGFVGYVAAHWHRFVEFINGIGKVPPSHQ